MEHVAFENFEYKLNTAERLITCANGEHYFLFLLNLGMWLAVPRGVYDSLNRLTEPSGDRAEAAALQPVIKFLKENRRKPAGRTLRSRLQEKIGPSNRTLNLDFHITDDCNLACTYCYRNLVAEKQARSLDFSIAGKVIDRFFKSPYKKISVQFIGGEPLLAFELIREITAYALQKARDRGILVSFSLTTNGLLLSDEKAKFFKAHKFHITVSIEGEAALHDQYRKTKNGRGSYSRVVEGIGHLRRNNMVFTARMTISKSSLPTLPGAVKTLFELGFSDVAYQLNTLPEQGQEFTAADLVSLNRAHHQLAELFLGNLKARRLQLFDQFYGYMRALIFKPGRNECSFLSEDKVIIDPRGDFYRCEMSVGFKDFKIGDYVQGIRKRKYNPVSPPAVRQRPACRACWLNAYCNGGCMFASYANTGAFEEPNKYFCSDNKITFLSSIYLLTSFYLADREGFDLLFFNQNRDKEVLRYEFETNQPDGIQKVQLS